MNCWLLPPPSFFPFSFLIIGLAVWDVHETLTLTFQSRMLVAYPFTSHFEENSASCNFNLNENFSSYYHRQRLEFFFTWCLMRPWIIKGEQCKQRAKYMGFSREPLIVYMEIEFSSSTPAVLFENSDSQPS